MANVVVTLKIMPQDPSVNLDLIKKQATEKISVNKGEVGKVEVVPIAFGLNALMVYFIQDEAAGGTTKLEEQISSIPGVNSVEVTDVRRTIG